MTVNLEDMAKQKGIRSFLISYTDLFGVQRAKLVPAAAGSVWRSARQAGAGGGDQCDGEGRGGLRGLRDMARHDTGGRGSVRDSRSGQSGAIAVETRGGLARGRSVDEPVSYTHLTLPTK